MLRYVGLLFVALLLACDGETPSVGLDASTDRGVDAPLAADAPPTRCASDRECSASGRVCNTATARCVECNAMADCDAGRACLGNRCITPVSCTTSRQCPGQVCNTTLGYCVDCNGDVDCTGGTVCRTNACVAPPRMCRSSRECSDIGQVCDTARSQCVDCVADADCAPGSRCSSGGLCAPAPPPSDAAMDTGPVDAVTDASPVDAGVDASPVDAMTDASMVVCVPGASTCPAGATARTVCNSDGRSTRSEPCPTPPNASLPRCGATNTCTFACNAGFSDCDGNPSNGCEADLASIVNCGRCGNTCAPGVACARGMCGCSSTCTPVFSGSGVSGGSGARCLATYTFNVIAGRTYTVSTCAMHGGDPYLVVSGACSCRNDDACGYGSECTCTATATGMATICASSVSGQRAVWNYVVTSTDGGCCM